MNRRNTFIAGFLAASAVFFGVAHARGPDCDMTGGPGMQRSSMQKGGMMEPGARVEQRLNRLKGELKLTAAQEPLWQAFAEKSKAEAGKGMQGMRERMQDDKPLSAPERMAQMQGMMKARVVAMESVNDSFNRLYAALMPEQKASVDKHFSNAGRHRHGSGRGSWRHDGQGVAGALESRKG